MGISMGIDIGSTASKAVILDNNAIVDSFVCPTGYSSVDASERISEHFACLGFNPTSLYCVATGYGRVAVPFANQVVTEITCHGKGAVYLFGENGTVIDVGGQDTKVISLSKGKVIKFNMNDKCSAGTGKFLEIMANRLGLRQEELAQLARAGQPTSISSMCTVFAESEVISLIGKGTPREDISYAVIESVVEKVCTLSAQGKGAPYFLTGGLCENIYVLERLSQHLGSQVKSCPQARFAGAIGAALIAEENRTKALG